MAAPPFPLALPTLTAGTLAAVNDGQNDRLYVSAGTLQTEETDRVLRVQPVTATVTKRLEVGLLRDGETKTDKRIAEDKREGRDETTGNGEGQQERRENNR